MSLVHLKRLPIQVNWDASTPAYTQVAGQLNCMIQTGQLSDGDLLPQIRVLAVQLDANPNTVARAYDELEKLGVLRKRQGSGCFVVRPKGVARTARERVAPLHDRIEELVADARNLGLTVGQLIEEIRRAFPEGAKPEQTVTHHPNRPPVRDSQKPGPPQPSQSLWPPADAMID